MQLVSLVYFRSTYDFFTRHYTQNAHLFNVFVITFPDTTRIDTHWWLPLQFLHTTTDDGHAPCPKHVERK